MAVDDQRSEIIERLLRARHAQVVELDEAAQSLRDLHVEQMRCMQPLVGRQCPHRDAFRPTGSKQQLEQGGGIDDDQRVSRSARTTSVGDVLPRYCSRCRKRSRISSGVGCSAIFRTLRIR